MVSVSGGPDSSALFHLIWHLSKQKINFQVALLHVDYGLRGAESTGDQAYCRDLASRYDVPFYVRVVSPEERSLRQAEGTQAWARRLRRAEYSLYSSAGWLIALGHHQGDLAENVLIRLARGAGPGQLLGMQAWLAPLWRPLLGFTKAEILAYLASHNLNYRNDASNQTLTYSRNVVRHKVLAELEGLYPGAAGRLIACAEEAAALAAAHQAKAPASGGALDLDALASQHPALARQELAQILRNPIGQPPRALSRTFLARVLAGGGKGGLVTSVPGGGHLTYRGGQLRFHQGPSPAKALRTAQHGRGLMPAPPAMLLAPGAYGYFRQGKGCLLFHCSASAALDVPQRLQLKPAGSRQSLRFYSLKRSFKFKDLLRSWGVTAALRPTYLLLTVAKQLVGVWDGDSLYQPNSLGKQTECSQADFNLRYLTDGVKYFR